MKTFSEACQEIFIKSTPKSAPKSQRESNIEKLLEAQERRKDLIKEIVESKEGEMLLSCYHQAYTQEESLCIDIIILNAFAQGVLVGMEMEKSDG